MSLCPHGYTAFYDCPECEEPMGTKPSVGQVMLDYSVRAETAAGEIRNALQIILSAERPKSAMLPRVWDAWQFDVDAIERLLKSALAKLESRGVS